MKYQKFIFLISIILLMNFVSAQPPIAQTGDFTEGLVIKFPPFGFITAGTNQTFNFHIFNISSGYPILDEVTCFFHLYEQDGLDEIYIAESTTFHGLFDIEFVVDGNNFTDSKEYGYTIQCNNSVIGGFDSINFKATPSGAHDITQGEAIIITCSLGVIFLLTILFFIIGLKFENIILRVGGIAFGSIGILTIILFTMVILYETIPTMMIIINGFETFFTAIKMLGTVLILMMMVVLILVAIKAWRIKRGLDGK